MTNEQSFADLFDYCRGRKLKLSFIYTSSSLWMRMASKKCIVSNIFAETLEELWERGREDLPLDSTNGNRIFEVVAADFEGFVGLCLERNSSFRLNCEMYRSEPVFKLSVCTPEKPSDTDDMLLNYELFHKRSSSLLALVRRASASLETVPAAVS